MPTESSTIQMMRRNLRVPAAMLALFGGRSYPGGPPGDNGGRASLWRFRADSKIASTKAEEARDAANRALWNHPSCLRMVAGEIFAGGHQRKKDREARKADRQRGEEGRADSRSPGAVLWAVLLRGAECEVVRADRECPQRAHARAHAKTGEETQNGV